ncbi:hypothetical protein [Halobaculum magnesiiphilum]|uniref:Uncharacterized protein n=1 Tax=Halobaculum magnesiiphilum TaxID=1017351 RepID=A0A8T8WFD2_9EURY|nr:hypothetical protein [Halobaculum magnesiiphilum]QZP38443.1 hypothetical protein K6T50_04695 [Halobaculum magnesiiphilum]
MGFEKFDESGAGRGRPAGTEPMISLRKSASIGVNRPALEEYFGDSEGAVMYYDEDENRVGIEPVADKDADEAAYTVSVTDSGGTIAPKAFLERYDLVPEVTTQFDPSWADDDEQSLIVLPLDSPSGTYGSADDGDDADGNDADDSDDTDADGDDGDGSDADADEE